MHMHTHREILKLISISQYVSITPITGITEEVNTDVVIKKLSVDEKKAYYDI